MKKSNRSILLVEDDETVGISLKPRLTNIGLDVTWEKNSGDALSAVKKTQTSGQQMFGLLVIDINLMAHLAKTDAEEGIALLRELRRIGCQSPAIVSTAYQLVFGDIPISSLQEELGIIYVHVKGEDRKDSLIDAIRDVLVPPQSIELPDPEYYYKKGNELKIVGANENIRHIFSSLLPQISKSDEPVLIIGEGGTRKENLARLIHENSNKKDGPFFAINCAAISPELIESELFGHKKGAFSGALSDKDGFFKVASKGTIFLDEVGELTSPTQVKLLRVLQEKEFIPVGSTEIETTETRIVCATNRNLEEMVKEGAFRSDLFYRISVLPIRLPPLRERGEKDIEMLIKHFLKEQDLVRGLDEGVLEALRNYHYPGNVRELRNLVHRLAIVAAGQGVIRARHLPPEIKHAIRPSGDILLEYAKEMAKLMLKHDWLDLQTIDRLLCNMIADLGGSAKDLGVSEGFFRGALLGTKEDDDLYIRPLIQELVNSNYSLDSVVEKKKVPYIRRKPEVIGKVAYWLRYVENVLKESLDTRINSMGIGRTVSIEKLRELAGLKRS